MDFVALRLLLCIRHAVRDSRALLFHYPRLPRQEQQLVIYICLIMDDDEIRGNSASRGVD